MSKSCPKCKTVELVSPGGRASRVLRCPSCRGTWLPEDEARVEAVGALLESDSTIRPGGELDSRTGLCPLGHGILVRARVETSEPFHLERCAECHGIWFDKGEWSKLASGHLLDHLDVLWDPAWRHQRVRERTEAAWRAGLQADLGDEVYEAVRALAEVLKGKPRALRGTALAFLDDELKR